ncbi:MAG: hypothetical protein AAGE84_24055 [Cyanobacteria bacterium P01_G01_bin.39]
MFTFNRTAKSFLGIVCAASTSAIIQQYPAQAEINNISELLVETANMMNKNLPMMVDSDTRWDSSFAGPGKMLSYKYTLIKYSASQIDGVQFAQNIRTPLTDTICNNPATQIFSENGVLLNFNYYDNALNLIARVEIAPEDCK